MPDDIDYTAASQSAPWFTQGEGGAGQGLSITTARAALTEQVTGVADDLSGQSDAVVTALTALAAAINAKPAA